jgi:hypothetical protein
MKPNATLTLILWATFAGLTPTVVAQDAGQIRAADHPCAAALAPAQSQKPAPVPSPKPVPLPDQQPKLSPAQQPPSAPPDDAQRETATQTFSGIIVKTGERYVLKTTEKATYDLDDQPNARKYEGKRVQVVGTLVQSAGLIHVQGIKAAG